MPTDWHNEILHLVCLWCSNEVCLGVGYPNHACGDSFWRVFWLHIQWNYILVHWCFSRNIWVWGKPTFPTQSVNGRRRAMPEPLSFLDVLKGTSDKSLGLLWNRCGPLRFAVVEKRFRVLCGKARVRLCPEENIFTQDFFYINESYIICIRVQSASLWHEMVGFTCSEWFSPSNATACGSSDW